MKELFIPLGLIAVIGSMMFPMHPALMDFLLVGNLIFALSLLISALYVSDSLKLSSLPTMLLLATLFRLALNVSSTRLILSTGEAGHVIEAFGKVMIEGNIVVGVVVFVVITLIQFIVIAKGSERVAEVSARFTLDALPGKQMSIDADLRAGLIDFATARDKRQELQTESRFYGALDGAMKFIKGDAIAGIVITIVNIVGGFLIGMIVEGIPAANALSRYSVLSIGDGLVSQIPALLNSLAAGMVVTRVSKGNDQSLANELVSQLGQLNNVKFILGIFSFIMAFMPGMPPTPFVILSLFLIGSGVAGLLKDKQKRHLPTRVRFQPKTCAALRIELHEQALFELRRDEKLLNAMEELRTEIFETRGLVLSLPELSTLSPTTASSCRLLVRGVPAKEWRSELKEGDFLKELITHLRVLIACRADELIDDALTRRALDYVEQEQPELVTTVVPGLMTVTQLSALLRSIVKEGVSIRNLDLVLQAVAGSGGKQGSERTMLEDVRIVLRRVISSHYADDKGVITGYTLVPGIDFAFMQTEREGRAFPLAYLDLIAGALVKRAPHEVLLVSRGARRQIRECLALKKIDIPVLAFEEVSDDVQFESVATIGIGVKLQGEEYEQLAA